MSNTARGIPTPSPIFAPFDNPFDWLSEVEGVVGVIVAVLCVVVLVCWLCDDVVDAAAEIIALSELWYHTGIPSPYMVQVLLP